MLIRLEQGKGCKDRNAMFPRNVNRRALIELSRSYPKLELDLSFSDRVVDLAEDGFDLAIRTGDLADRAGVLALRIAHQPMIVCAAPAYQGTWSARKH